MSFFLNQYKRVLQRWPIAVQALQAGGLMGVGDILAQTSIEGRSLKEVKWKRTLQFSSVGFVVIGPPLRIWYGVLDRYFGRGSQIAALKKTAVDQFIFAPLFIVCVMGSISTVQGESLSDTRLRLQRDYKDVLFTNYKIWPAVQLVNFYIVPLQYQVLIVQIVAVFWNTYLSWKTNTTLKTEDSLR